MENPTGQRQTGPSSGRLGLDPYAERLIAFKARQLAGRYGFVPEDVDDIRQDLTLDLLRRLPRFDPQRASLKTFTARVVDHAVATIIERRTAACRDWRRTATFSDLEREDDEGAPIPFEDGFDPATYLRLTGRTDPMDSDHLSLHLELERLLDSLPDSLRDLCRCLKVESVSEISERTGIPRTTLYGRIERIRARFERAGLGDYLSLPTNRDPVR